MTRSPKENSPKLIALDRDGCIRLTSDVLGVEPSQIDSEITAVIGDVLSTLTVHEGRVLVLRYGLQDGKAQTLANVGQYDDAWD